MNRILQVDNGFQVLVTQHYVSNPSFELMLGNWTDAKMQNYKIYQFTTFQDAMDLAFSLPPIDWNKIVSLHEDAFHTITSSIKKTLQYGSFIVETDSRLLNPTELKETMFRRVAQNGVRFSLFYDMNDVICINIINPWTNNLVEISNILKAVPDLRINKVIKTKTHIKLIGLTDVDTVYEIRLWTSLMAQCVRWIFNNNLDKRSYVQSVESTIQKQKIIDNGDIVIR